MDWSKNRILSVLDQCAKDFTFPMLDNGYVYLAATRMSVVRTNTDWAIVVEIFGFSPRSGRPDTQISTFSSNLHNRNSSSNYATEDAYRNYLKANPYNESRFIFPIDNNDWLDDDNSEYVKARGICQVRGTLVEMPTLDEYQKYNIALAKDVPLTFEFCRYLAGAYRDLVLANEAERRISILPRMEQLLQLEEWNHPDIVSGELPSETETFSQIADVLITGDKSKYDSYQVSNTHWRNWPDGGTL